jgi:hypothetical protein
MAAGATALSLELQAARGNDVAREAAPMLFKKFRLPFFIPMA